MSLHRLLQRGFAKLFGYKQTLSEPPVDITDYSMAVLVADSVSDLNYKMKGARFMPSIRCVRSLLSIRTHLLSTIVFWKHDVIKV